MTVWCIFWMSADLPPRSPSTTTYCHSGRVRSNGSATIKVARSSNWRIDPGPGQCDVPHVVIDREVGILDPCGADTLPGAGCTRWRSRGIAMLARSNRRRIRSTSGLRSRIVTLPNVDVRYGSFSRRHINPSTSLIFRSK